MPRAAPRQLVLALALASSLTGCMPAPDAPPGAAAAPDKAFALFRAGDALVKEWRRIQVWGETDWDLVTVDGDIAIRPIVEESSSALVRWIEFDTRDCPVAEWTWRVDALPDGADLSSREAEDVAASVMFVFGDPGTMLNPDRVPTLRYVWAAEDAPGDAVVDSPYFPGVLRSMIVRRGGAGAGWVTERRNLRDDYRAAFGDAPSENVRVFALFSDNDHLGRPVTAYYLSARMLCSDLPRGASVLDLVDAGVAE